MLPGVSGFGKLYVPKKVQKVFADVWFGCLASMCFVWMIQKNRGLLATVLAVYGLVFMDWFDFEWPETVVTCLLGLHDAKLGINLDDDGVGQPDETVANPMEPEEPEPKADDGEKKKKKSSNKKGGKESDGTE